LEDRRVNLGCVMPGESPAVFGDALRRLTASATYLYQDGPRVWYSTQPTVTKLAEDRAEQLKRDPDKVATELDKRLRVDVKKTGDFGRAPHCSPKSGADVEDYIEARLVVLGPETPYSKEAGNPAEAAATAILEMRGNTPRLYRNSLVFLAADKTRLQDLDEAIRKYLAWETIVDDSDKLNLDPNQKRQAETQKRAADSAIIARLPETYQWLLVPTQKSPQSAVEWNTIRLTGSDALAARASKKLRSDESLVTTLGASTLRKYLDEVPLWRGDHVPIRQLVEDFGRYTYLQRLVDPAVLIKAICDGVGSMTWVQDTFAYADGFDEMAGRYRGLIAGRNLSLTQDSAGILVKPDRAYQQINAEVPAAPTTGPSTIVGTSVGGQGSTVITGVSGVESTPKVLQPTRFHGTVVLDPARVGRDASRIADEVISHLAGLVGAKVTVTLEIDTEIPGGVPEQVVRIVTENGRTLKFTSQGFEKE
jgi:hypothetical protein